MIKPEISPVYVLTEEQYDELINSIDEIEETSFNEGYEVGFADGELENNSAHLDFEAGYTEGYEEGKISGGLEPNDTSFEEGRKLGYQEGLNKGYEMGVNDQGWENDLDEIDLDEEIDDDEWDDWEKDSDEPENNLSGLVFGYDGEKDKQAMLIKMRSSGLGIFADFIEKNL